MDINKKVAAIVITTIEDAPFVILGYFIKDISFPYLKKKIDQI